MRLFPRRTGVFALLGFALLACAQAWPLPLHLSTALTGPPSGDAGVYVWNTWVFRHELLDVGRLPYATDTIFWSGRTADLSLHNYTPFADLLTLPLQPLVGVVAAFNLVYLVNVALAGFGMFLLARRFTSHLPTAWLAGAMFSCAPFLVARSEGHFSLAAAAPLPLFVWQLLRTLERPSVANAAGVGVMFAWAGACDPYYAVYCLMLGLAIVASRVWAIDWRRPRGRWRPARLDMAIGLAACVVAALAWVPARRVALGPLVISMTTLFTPVLLLTACVLARLLTWWRPHVRLRALPGGPVWRAGAWASFTASVLLSPWLHAILLRLRSGTMVPPPVLWRSSTPGVDLLSFVLPNPTHPLTPLIFRSFLAAGPGGFIEQVASLPICALAVIAIAWRARARLHRGWIALTCGFAACALGPFVHIAGVNTYLPTPWTLLRYVPVIAEARAPSRFSVLVVMGCCVLFAQALTFWCARWPARARLVWTGTAVLLAVELLPAPRTLYSAVVPSIYHIVAADTRNVGVLELPFGLRDGLSSSGDFTAATQFFQTFHQKPVFGGYLSRISEQRKARYRARPVLGALMALSEGRPLSAEQRARAKQGVLSFLKTAALGYVVIDEGRTSPELRQFAIDLLGLRRVAEGGGRELLVPGAAHGGP